jgi:hypothetical protein
MQQFESFKCVKAFRDFKEEKVAHYIGHGE